MWFLPLKLIVKLRISRAKNYFDWQNFCSSASIQLKSLLGLQLLGQHGSCYQKVPTNSKRDIEMVHPMKNQRIRRPSLTTDRQKRTTFSLEEEFMIFDSALPWKRTMKYLGVIIDKRVPVQKYPLIDRTRWINFKHKLIAILPIGVNSRGTFLQI